MATSTRSLYLLKKLHNFFCHLGITGRPHYVTDKDLLFSLGDVKTVIKNGSDCYEIKPFFFKSKENFQDLSNKLPD